MTNGTQTAMAGDDEPPPISKLYLEKIKKSPLTHFLLIFLVVYMFNTAFLTVASVEQGTATFHGNVTGEVVTKLKVEKVKRVKRTRVKRRSVNCDLVYPMVPELKKQIHLTMANCDEQRTLAYIAHKESTGGLKLKNPISSASGPYQFLDTSWNYLCSGNKNSFATQTNCALMLIRRGETYDTWYRWWE